MGADNWRQCPKCLAKAKKKQAERELSLADLYGKVPEAEYLVRVAEIKKSVVHNVTEEFREDFHIGINEDGEFYVAYQGYCKRCGWGHDFKHEKKLDISDESE